MEPVDARAHWMASRIPSDQFLLYTFDLPDPPLDVIAEMLVRRASRVPDLTLRIREVPGTLDRPYWVGAEPEAEQLRIHHGPWTWQGCLDRLGELMSDQVDPTRHTWRIHLFGPVDDEHCVMVLQISHAVGDGRRTSSIARELLAPDLRPRPDAWSETGVPGIAAAALGLARFPIGLADNVFRGIAAARTAPDRRAPAGVAPTSLNRPPGPDRLLRTITVGRAELTASGHSVTVSVLRAIALALPAYLDDDPDLRPVVEVTIGERPNGECRNNFRNVGIDLSADITGQIRRARAGDPARRAARRAEDATPARLACWGIALFDPMRPPTTMTGITVVSSVDRGPADLDLAGAPVLSTAGFPALSPAQGLTHGIHGLGDTVTVSLTTSSEICPDIDDYVALLTHALSGTGRARST
ncbi:wax ester/triacylglycerol synthase domain-containing protein [Gordonia sp. NPDC003376]